MTGPSPDRSVDRAALLGTSLAAVVALTFGGRGAWEWLASVVGLALLAVLVAFFRLSDSESVPVRERVALAAVAALCATLVVAAPLQAVLTLAGPVGGFCADVGAAAAAAVPTPPGLDPGVVRHAAIQTAATASDDCLGAATNRWLWVPALAFAAVFLGVVTRAARRGGDPGDG